MSPLLPVALLACALLGDPAVQDPSAEPAAPAPPPAVLPLQLTILANEGVLLRAGEQAVLIDAFLAEPYSLYEALPADALAALRRAAPPFDRVDLALVSHHHRDHVQAEPARAFLAASPDTLLASSPQVLALLADAEAGAEAEAETAAEAGAAAAAAAAAEAEAGAPRTPPRALLPEPAESIRLEHAGVTVDVLRLSHGTGRFAAIQNLGHVVELGGQRVLHVGDAAMVARHFTPYALPERELDVALLPYWYFLDPGGRALVREELTARVVIAVHVPPDERADVAAALARTHPRVIVPGGPLQAIVVEPRVAAPDDGG